MPPDPSLSLFEAPPALLGPMLQACRLFNTGLDTLFYDVPGLVAALGEHGEGIDSQDDDTAPNRPHELDLGALRNPEGALLIIDAAGPPYVTAFDDVEKFLTSADPLARRVSVASLTGVGSSALGSAALAWNISAALKQPVLAIVPGYGVADALLQGLGGWYGFGLHDFLNTKARLQTFLAAVAPRTAAIGRRLSASAPGARTLANGGPVFRTGCGSSDVLHAVLQARPLTHVIGHSKGALSIANALDSLPPERTQGLKVVTLGCPVAEDAPGAEYRQVLGLFDALGALNAWGHSPNRWAPTDHSTNVQLPLSMNAEALVEGCAAEGISRLG